jgi:hypothetical protein
MAFQPGAILELRPGRIVVAVPTYSPLLEVYEVTKL